jgi:hypothetical protein
MGAGRESWWTPTLFRKVGDRLHSEAPSNCVFLWQRCVLGERGNKAKLRCILLPASLPRASARELLTQLEGWENGIHVTRRIRAEESEACAKPPQIIYNENRRFVVQISLFGGSGCVVCYSVTFCVAGMNTVHVVAWMICGTHSASVVFHFVIVRGMGRNKWFGFEPWRSRLVVHLTFYYKA